MGKKQIKFLIIGGEGTLGSFFAKQYAEVSLPVGRKELDIRDLDSLYEIISDLKPEFVLNSAAITDLTKCELNPKDCWEVNFFGVRNLVEVCRELKVKLIHLSSDSAIEPTNNYGWSKKASEGLVLDEGLVVRTDFYSLKTYLVQELLKKKPTKAYLNVFVSPVSINRLVKEIYLNKEKIGLINLFGEKTSWFNFGLKFAEVFQIPRRLVKESLYRDSEVRRALVQTIKSDIKVELEKDLLGFKEENVFV